MSLNLHYQTESTRNF